MNKLPLIPVTVLCIVHMLSTGIRDLNTLMEREGEPPYLLCVKCACSGRQSASSCAGYVGFSAGTGMLLCSLLLQVAGNIGNWT